MMDDIDHLEAYSLEILEMLEDPIFQIEDKDIEKRLKIVVNDLKQAHEGLVSIIERYT